MSACLGGVRCVCDDEVGDDGGCCRWSVWGIGLCFAVFFFNDTATTEIYTLSLHDALPIFSKARALLQREMGSIKSRALLQREIGILKSEGDAEIGRAHV